MPGFRGRIPPIAILLFSLVALAGSAPCARAGDVGIDSAHGWSEPFVLATGSAFDGFRLAIATAGHRIVPLDSFDAARIASLEALVLLQPYDQNESLYSESEIAAIHEFVERGGGLVALAEAGSGGSASALENWNRLAAPFGVAFAGETTEPAGRTIEGFASHPVTAGVSSAGIDYERRLSVIGSPAIDLTLGAPRDDAFAAAGGAGLGGRSFFCGDTSLFMDDDAGSDRPLSFGDNALLLDNVLRWVLEPPHVRCLAGNVNAALGPPVDVLFVNDSAGGVERKVELASWEPIDVFVAAPPGSTSRAPFVLYGWTAEPGPETVRELPRGIGCTCRPTPISGGDPTLRVAWNNWGHARVLGVPLFESAPAPTRVYLDRNGSHHPMRVFLQGLILDAHSPSGRAAVTNGLTLAIR